MPDEGLVAAYSGPMISAKELKQRLEARGIKAFLKSDGLCSVDGLEPVEVIVPRRQHLDAEGVIQAFLREMA